jgi:hypothetical protein
MQPLHERKVNEARGRLGIGNGMEVSALVQPLKAGESGYFVGLAAASRSRVYFAATLRSVDAKSRGRMADELAGRADGPVDQLAGAIGAKAAERSRAVHAERALEGTDPRVGRVRRQIPIAALTAGSNLEHLASPS